MKKIWILIICLAPAALAQEKTLTCDSGGPPVQPGHYCEMREVTMPFAGQLEVDGEMNGGVSIQGANRSDILVRSRVQAHQDDESESRRIVAAVRVEATASHVHATGPSEERHHGWSVSYEVFVPQKIDLVLRTHNGGITIAGVQGHVQFEAVNGGVTLKSLAGSVQGHTTNGGLHLELASDRWDGDQCDVWTTNGGVTIQVPANYSAHLETGTVNGGISIDFPLTIQGEINRQIAVDLGSGGRLVRAKTTNGGVRVERI